MNTGRPSKKPRSDFGKRLHAIREDLGLSQAQVASQLGITQTAYALWERQSVSIKLEQIEKLSETLKVPVSYLFGENEAKQRGKGPSGKLSQVLERASQLPKSQQNKIAEFVEAFINEQQRKAS